MDLHPTCEKDIRDFIAANLDGFKRDCVDFECYREDDEELIGLELTIGTDGESFGFQTGDNSFAGGAYGFPVWGVSWVTPETTAEELTEHILDQLYDQLWEID